MSHKVRPEKAKAVRALGARGISQREIAVMVGISKGSVSSILSRRPPPAARPQPPKSPSLAVKSPKLSPEPELEELAAHEYWPDEEAIDAHVEALAEWIDVRVDAAVAAENDDPTALEPRLRELASAAGWPVCAECGQHVAPKGSS